MSYAEDETPVEPKGTWQADPNGMAEGDGQFTYTSHALNEQGHHSQFTVVTYMGVDDGKPVIQIDGEGDFRINVNDSTIYDRDTDSESRVNIAALALYKKLAGIDHAHYFDLAELRAELVAIGFTLPELEQ